MSDQPPYFAFYPRDFAASGKVEAMTTEEVGAYMLLLCKAWLHDPPCAIPDDDRILARWTRLGDRWSTAKAAVLSCFSKRADGFLYQERLEHEYRALRSLQRQRSEGGKRGAAKRWVSHGSPNGPPIGEPMAKDGTSSSPPIRGDVQPDVPGFVSVDSSDARARKVAALIAATDPPPSGPFYDTAEDLLAGLFGRQGGLPCHESRYLGEFAVWIESQPPPSIHGETVTAEVLALRCVEAAVQDRIDGTVKGAVAWCRQVYDRCVRQGCWPHQTPERKSKFEVVKPKRDIDRLVREEINGSG